MFKLHRYFSITSIIGTLFIAVILLILYRHFAFIELLDHESRSNHNVAQLISKAIWPDYAEFIIQASDVNPNELRQSTEIQNLKSDLGQLVQGLNIIDIKLYSPNGKTIFSSNAQQLGDISSSNSIVSINSTNKISSINFVDSFDAFEGGSFKGSLVSSYIVIQPNDIVADTVVIEVHSDVTDLVNAINSSQWKIVLGTLTCLGFIYIFLFLIMKHSDKMRFAQEERLQESEGRLKSHNSYDSLTGLPTRPIILDRLKQAMARSEWNNRCIAIATIDLDGFHVLNETLGHDVGDKFLIAIAKRLEKSLRGGDTVARIESDKFVLLLNDMANSADISIVANKILASIRQPVEIFGKSVRETASMGIAFYPTDGKDAKSILHKSDEALYIAKADGRNKYYLYSITDDVVQKQAAQRHA